MKYVVGYRGFEIIREDQGKPFKIYRNGKLATEAVFWDFASARRECDWLR